MQFITFLIVIILVSKFVALSWLNSFYYALGLLIYLLIGNFIIAVILGQIMKVLIKEEDLSEIHEIWIRRTKIATPIQYTISIIIVIIISYLIAPLLVISGLIGLLLMFLGFKVGQKQYQRIQRNEAQRLVEEIKEEERGIKP